MQTNNLAIISNITLEPFVADVIKEKFNEININDYTVDFLTVGMLIEKISIIQQATHIIIFVNLDILMPYTIRRNNDDIDQYQKSTQDCIKYFRHIIDTIKINSEALITLIGLEDYDELKYELFGWSRQDNFQVDKINIVLSEAVDQYVDLKSVIALLGVKKSYNRKYKALWNMPYTSELIKKVFEAVFKQYYAYIGISPKCIVLDCDGVLWGGVLVEDGIENIELGTSGLGNLYQEFQKGILQLYYSGVIIVLCSKNNKDDVKDVFLNHSAMLIDYDKVAYSEINWNKKSLGVSNIINKLNIGVDSIVFVDDTESEINEVKSNYPSITTELFDIKNYREVFKHFNLYEQNYKDIIKRNLTYKDNIKRESFLDKNDAVINTKISTKIEINIATLSEALRISELSQRTNKFTNGYRYTSKEIVKKINDVNSKVFSVYASDEFGDLGLIGAIIIKHNEIKLFCLSCRAFNRNIEKFMIERVCEEGAKSIYIINTGKNKEVKRFFENIQLIVTIID
ncbi:HAD-IIIC family phosphatase [Clostridium sp.]|uniref:HAD-IIIC family phosphatase n=1 Tax=Clostridium sp. TaxID=1506 RepID=UPI003F3ED128